MKKHKFFGCDRGSANFITPVEVFAENDSPVQTQHKFARLTHDDDPLIQTNMELARLATEYACSNIQFSHTRLECNEFPWHMTAEIRSNIMKLRKHNQIADYFSLGKFEEIEIFYRWVYYILQFNKGNCCEFSILALHFMLLKAPDIRAEYFAIKNGDHAFLVIGRNLDSYEDDPLTWGDAAFICDPWSRKFYPARYYLTELENYVFHWDPIRQIGLNKVESFDSNKHILARENWSSTIILSGETMECINDMRCLFENLVKNFIEQAQQTLFLFITLRNQLPRNSYAAQFLIEEEKEFIFIIQSFKLLSETLSSMLENLKIKHPNAEQVPLYLIIKGFLEGALRNEGRCYLNKLKLNHSINSTNCIFSHDFMKEVHDIENTQYENMINILRRGRCGDLEDHNLDYETMLNIP